METIRINTNIVTGEHYNRDGNSFPLNEPKIIVNSKFKLEWQLYSSTPNANEDGVTVSSWTKSTDFSGCQAKLTCDNDWLHRVVGTYSGSDISSGSTIPSTITATIASASEKSISSLGKIRMYNSQGQFEDFSYTERSVSGNTVTFTMSTATANYAHLNGEEIAATQEALFQTNYDSTTSDPANGFFAFEVTATSRKLQLIADTATAGTVEINGIELLPYKIENGVTIPYPSKIISSCSLANSMAEADVNSNSFMDTSGATATANTISSGYTAYANGEKLTGTLVVLDTSDADATAANIDSGKTAYVDGVKLTGTSTKKDVSQVDAAAGDIRTGKKIVDANGDVVTGTLTPLDTSDATAAAGNIQTGYTAYVDGLKITGTHTCSGTDVSDTTATNHDVLSGVDFYTAAGVKTQGTITRVSSQPSPTASVNASTGLVTATYTPLAGYSEDNTAKSGTLQLNSSNVPTLLASNIKKDVNILGVTGTHEGGSAAVFDLYKVTAYTPYSPAVPAQTGYTIALDPDDYSCAGTYAIQSGLESATGKARRYACGSHYLVCVNIAEGRWATDADDASDCTWYLTTTNDPHMGSYDYNMPASDFPGGSWEQLCEEDITSQSTTAVQTSPATPAVQQVLTGAQATAYDTSTKTWTFSSSSTSLTGFEASPDTDYVYACRSGILIGSSIAYVGSLYHILWGCNSLPITGLTTVNTTVSTSEKKYGSGSLQLANGYMQFTPEIAVNSSSVMWTMACFLKWSESSERFLFNNDTNETGAWGIIINSGTSSKLWQRGGSEPSLETTLNDGIWHHIRLTHAGSGVLKAYVDGVLKATITDSSISAGGSIVRIGCKYQESSSSFNGYIDEFEFWELDANTVDKYSGSTAPVPQSGY